MKLQKTATHIKFENALQLGPPPVGNLAVPVFHHGSMEAELYLPKDLDSQNPHDRDEIYIVVRGSGEFYNGEKSISIEPGSFIFVPAGVEHRFEKFADDLAVWVFFYGPEGGEVKDE